MDKTLFDLYTDYLLCSFGSVTASGLSQLVDGVIIIDDTVAEKTYTDENELICWHYDNAKERSVKGINFLTALYHVAGVSLPVAFDLLTKTERYYAPKAKKEKRRSALSKNARFRTLLQVCVHNEILFQYVLADLW